MAYSHKSGWYTPSEKRYENECLKSVLKKMDDLWDDPAQRKELLQRCEQTHRELTRMSMDDMLKPWYVK